MNPEPSLEPSTTTTLHECLKLFGARFGLFEASKTDYTVVNTRPLLLDSSVSASSSKNPKRTFIPSFGKEAPLPRLVTFASSLPEFQCPFAMTSIPKGLELADASNEESLDRACSCLMEGIHLLNEGIRVLHENMDVEAKDLREEVHGLLERIIWLGEDLCFAAGDHVSGKDVSIKLLEEEFSKVKTGVSEKDAQIAFLGELQTSAKQDWLQYLMISERGVSYFQWVMKED
ncbi:unnamed protein product [Lactuca virosa]|uniref:Uncharacterized protein n=1 Tax=Lactuca virosa TaxID=75947 RepID=A0AAU9P7J0_9ASTR|nr:unnamed protein product [Lactuca virosa]